MYMPGAIGGGGGAGGAMTVMASASDRLRLSATEPVTTISDDLVFACACGALSDANGAASSTLDLAQDTSSNAARLRPIERCCMDLLPFSCGVARLPATNSDAVGGEIL